MFSIKRMPWYVLGIILHIGVNGGWDVFSDPRDGRLPEVSFCGLEII
jgi:hypothetical protein